MNIRNVQLDNRSVEHLESVEDRNRGERKSGGIDDDATPHINRFVNPVYELSLAVGLTELDGAVAGCFG